jgi:hypothetical protein
MATGFPMFFSSMMMIGGNIAAQSCGAQMSA